MNLRIVTCGLAASAAFGALPLAATAQTLTITSPTSGATLSGSSNPCGASAPSGTSYVRFYRDGSWMNTDTASPFTCNIDATSLSSGTHKLTAVSYNDYNSVNGQAAISFTVGTASTGTSTGGTTGGTTTGTGTTSTSSGGLTIASPTSGATLSGSTNPCAASAPSGTSYVRFYRDGSWMNTDTASPFTCNIDATSLSSGTHKLTAVSYNDYNSVNGQAAISFTVGTASTGTSTGGTTTGGTTTGGTTTGGTTSIASSDIINTASTSLPFSQQSGYNTQCMGQYLYATDIPESGLTYTLLSDGETVRLGHYTDPRDSSRTVAVHQVDPGDPSTSGAKRCEIKFPNNIQQNHTYWAAVSVYVYDWGTLSSSDNALFGLQQHNGSPLDLSPNFAIYTYGDGRSFQIQARGSNSTSPSYSNTTTVRSTPQPIPFGRWTDFVFKFKLDPYGSGFVQVWQDGTQILNFNGMLGYITPGYTDFFKFGYYNWSGSSFASTRKVLLRSPVIVSDPTGSTYTQDQLRSYVSAR